jgi:hypothetical protein
MWKRIGWVDVPVRKPSWWASHLAFPTVLAVRGGEVQLVVSTRDQDQKSSAAILTLNVSTRDVIVDKFPDIAVLQPGDAGTFDEAGVNVTYAELVGERMVVWYHGWFLRFEKGWLNSIGVASGFKGEVLARHSPAPVFDRSAEDPTSLGYPYWVESSAGKVMYYCSYEQYGVPSANEEYSYRVKMASGRTMRRSGPLLPHLGRDQAQSRPCVVQHAGVYRMFLSVKGAKYRIRSAESSDGQNWSWADEKWGLNPLGLGRETDEVAYGVVAYVRNQLVMFYNGDGHGATGIGVAIWTGND